ncbi:molybdenum cofactor guanylyltransferase [Cognatilysobacter segetis]|uniref:molybdenum cofactor guanylyltransferase n=1 Tax=Cognatilysobacter segetis TaxID=2492394 RepID=UPI001EE4C978|nr:molybdenum cofactor guanylyltransferase [Lysobacter segetis]
MSDRPFTGIVLAGGRSSRMGVDKALLMLDGRSLLDTAIARLREAGAEQVLVSGERPAHAGVPDRTAGLGPVGGLASVMAACPDGAAVVVPVDMPRLSPGALRRLVDALDTARAVYFDGHPLPCGLRVDDATRAAIAACVAAAPHGPALRSLLRGLGAVTLQATDAADFENVNTPAAWAAFSS